MSLENKLMSLHSNTNKKNLTEVPLNLQVSIEYSTTELGKEIVVTTFS
jgi:hypothetical protein